VRGQTGGRLRGRFVGAQFPERDAVEAYDTIHVHDPHVSRDHPRTTLERRRAVEGRGVAVDRQATPPQRCVLYVPALTIVPRIPQRCLVEMRAVAIGPRIPQRCLVEMRAVAIGPSSAS
jgi:hypothetical protein